MDKEELIQFEGSIVDVLPDGRFRVRLDNGHEILAYTSLSAFLTENADFRAGPFQVECFSLIESRPGAEGAMYEHKADCALR